MELHYLSPIQYESLSEIPFSKLCREASRQKKVISEFRKQYILEIAHEKQQQILYNKLFHTS